MTFETALKVGEEHLAHQGLKTGSHAQAVIDAVTVHGLADLLYSDTRPFADVGLVGAIFPKDYGLYEKGRKRNVTVPFFHQTEFLVKASPSCRMNGEFRFLQARFKKLQQYKKNAAGKTRWHPPSTSARLDGEEFRGGPDAPIPHIVAFGPLKLGELTDSSKTNGPAMFPFTYPDGAESETLDSKESDDKVRVTVERAMIKGKLRISASQVHPGLYRIRAVISNETQSGTVSGNRPFKDDEVMLRTLFAARLLITVSGGKVVPPNPQDEKMALGNQKRTQVSANVNTIPTISKEDAQSVYASPVILSDRPRQDAVQLNTTLDQMSRSPESVMESLYLLTSEERAFVKSNWLGKLHGVLQALTRTNPERITKLYKFQWDAIQLFIKSLIHGDAKPFTLKAPTGSGKSLVFYVDSVLMNVLPSDVHGTSSFISFPTRALNSQQFSEMVGFFFHLNQRGIGVSLGLYMGRDDENDREAAVKSLSPWNIKEGDPIGNIQRCPNCGEGPFIAKKPTERRILPVCSKCNTALSYLYLSNYETQRFCPSVVVGTPDKLVNAISYDVYSHILIGAPAKECPKCGQYYPLCLKDQKDEVSKCQGCGTALGPETKTHTTPRLVIFDEIHTLTGTQGNLLAHFLALIRVLSHRYTGFDKHWYVGGSATVEDPEHLVAELTGVSRHEVFPKVQAVEGEYFITRNDSLRHRYVVFEPVRRTTEGSVSWLSLGIYGYLQSESNKESRLGVELAEAGAREEDLKVQAIYVLRKSDGRNLDNYIPALATGLRLQRTPSTKFGSGDMTEMELADLNKRVRRSELDILLVTSIYGVGVDFPNLNIIHLFGTPRSFIELSQVVGRTGRENLPGLVFLHVLPPVPRDQWVYQNFRFAVEQMQDLLEPAPINAMNRYAISVSAPNVFNALVMSRSYENHLMRYASHVASEFLADKGKLTTLLLEMVRVYERAEAHGEMPKVKNLIFNRVRQTLVDFRTSTLETTKHLEQQQMLVPTLRGKSKLVYYSESQSYPALEGIELTREISNAAMRPREGQNG